MSINNPYTAFFFSGLVVPDFGNPFENVIIEENNTLEPVGSIMEMYDGRWITDSYITQWLVDQGVEFDHHRTYCSREDIKAAIYGAVAAN